MEAEGPVKEARCPMAPVLAMTCRILRVTLGVLLIYSGMIKVVRPYEFLHAVFQYQLFGATGATLFAAGLPFLELTIGLALVCGVCALGATLAERDSARLVQCRSGGNSHARNLRRLRLLRRRRGDQRLDARQDSDAARAGSLPPCA